MPHPRVAIIFDNFGPYHWTRLEAAGRTCDLVAIEVRDNCAEHGWVRQPRLAPFRTITLVKGGPDKELDLRDMSARLGEALAELKPQVVFLPGWSCAASFVAHHWCNINSVPAVVMSESNSWDEKRSALKEWVKRRLTRMYSAALVGGTTHKHYMMELGLPAERIFTGYDAVDNHYFSAKATEVRSQERDVISRQGLPDHFFLASARFVEKKNLPRLIQAYARYRELASSAGNGKRNAANTPPQPSPLNGAGAAPWDLVLLGDGPLRSTLDAQLSALNLRDHVRLPGFVQYENLPTYYGLASAFIHSSTIEQWGLVVNEAMASGVPVLVSDRCGCAADLVAEGVNGFRFDPLNVEQLVQLMVRCSAAGFQLSAFGAESRKIISDWSPERFGHGARAAAETALTVGAQRSSIADKVLLRSLVVFKQK